MLKYLPLQYSPIAAHHSCFHPLYTTDTPNISSHNHPSYKPTLHGPYPNTNPSPSLSYIAHLVTSSTGALFALPSRYKAQWCNTSACTTPGIFRAHRHRAQPDCVPSNRPYLSPSSQQSTLQNANPYLLTLASIQNTVQCSHNTSIYRYSSVNIQALRPTIKRRFFANCLSMQLPFRLQNESRNLQVRFAPLGKANWYTKGIGTAIQQACAIYVFSFFCRVAHGYWFPIQDANSPD